MSRPRITLVLLLLFTLAAAPPAVRKDHHGDPLPPNVVTRLGTLRFRHPGGFVIGLGVSPDDRTIVTADRHGGVVVWDAATGRAVRAVKMDYFFRDFALSADGKRLAVTGTHLRQERWRETVVRIEEVATGKEVRTWQRQDERPGDTKLAFTPDGRKLAVIGSDGILRLEDIATGTEVVRLQLPPAAARTVAVSPDGTAIAVAQGPFVHVWRWQTPGKPVQFNTGRELMSLCFSPDGKHLAGGDDYGAGLRIWDASDGKKVRTLSAGSMMEGVRYSPDGKSLVAFNYNDAVLQVFEVATGKELHRFACSGSPKSLGVFTSDSRRLVAQQGGVIRIWDVATGKEAGPGIEGHEKAPSFVSLTGNVAITSSDDGTVRIWDATTGKQTRRIDVSRSWVRGAAVSRDGRWVATSELGEKHAVCLWEVKTGKRIYRLAGHGRSGGARSLQFTADSKRLVSWGDDQYLRVWDVKTGKAVEEHGIAPDGQGGPVREALMDPRARLMFFANGTLSDDGELFALPANRWLYIFEVMSGKQTLKWKSENGNDPRAFSPDKKQMALIDYGESKQVTVDGKQRFERGDPSVRLFDVASGVQIKSVGLPNGASMGTVAFRPDGKRFAVTVFSDTSFIRLFDDEGNDRGKIALPARAWSLAFSDGGKRLIAGLDDATAVILNAPSP